MRAVLKYPGAKNRIAKWIVSFVPEHKVYCEPFMGSAAVFFNKKPCHKEILNDLDDDVYNFFKMLRSRGDELIRSIAMTPYGRTEYEEAYKTIASDKLEQARLFAIKCCQGFGAGNKYKNGFRRGLGITSPNPAKAWNELPLTLSQACVRLKNAQIENKDALELISVMTGENTFIYIDPPYLQNTRKKYLYNHEMNDYQHIQLLDMISKSTCKIMISGYDNSLYNDYLYDWRKKSKNTIAECSVKRTETIWMNY